MTYFESQAITFDAALRDLASGSERSRAQAAFALGDVVAPEQRERAVEALAEATGSHRPQVRAAACTSLGELGGDRAVEALLLVLDDGVPHVRQTAAIALGRAGSSAAFEPLLEKLRSGPPDLRFQAATSVVEIDADRSLEPLLSALKEESDAEVIGAIALALGAVGDRRARAPLAPHLESSRRETRFEVAYALARLGDPRGVPELRPYLGEREKAWDAIEALELSGDPDAAAPLGELLERRFTPREHQLRAAAAILALPPKQNEEARGRRTRAREELCAGLSAWKLHHRALAVELLGRVGGEWAAEPLRALRRRRAGRPLAGEIDECLANLQAEERPA